MLVVHVCCVATLSQTVDANERTEEKGAKTTFERIGFMCPNPNIRQNPAKGVCVHGRTRESRHIARVDGAVVDHLSTQVY